MCPPAFSFFFFFVLPDSLSARLAQPSTGSSSVAAAIITLALATTPSPLYKVHTSSIIHGVPRGSGLRPLWLIASGSLSVKSRANTGWIFTGMSTNFLSKTKTYKTGLLELGRLNFFFFYYFLVKVRNLLSEICILLYFTFIS